EMETAIFGCASEVFLSPEASSQFRLALKKALGPRNFDFLMGYLAFIRTAHFWTLTHPELDHDEDMNALLKNHEELSKGLLEDPEAGRCDFGQRFSKELSELRREKQTHEKLLEAQTKQIEMSKEIKKAKDFLESVIEIVPVGLSISEAPSGKALFNNKEIEDIAGVPIHTRVSIEGYDYGVRYLDGRIMPPDQYPSVRSMREGIKIHNEELFLINPKKGKRDLIISSSPVRGDNQKVVAVVTSVVDITEVKETQRKLKDALAVRDEFLSIASHELKTPLTVLSLETEMMQIDLEGAKDLDTVKEYLEQVNTHVSRMVQLVDDMMDIARIRSGKLALVKTQVKLSSLINSVLRSLGHKFTKSIEGAIKVDVHEDILVNIDVGRMQQVVTNLLTNAQKYGRGGDIAINAGASEDGFYIKVKDHGIGIEKDKLELIFKRFERAINKNEVSGLGLGLYIVNQIVEAHGGKIHVTSKLGEGSEFCVEVPLKTRK
ncbi:MAG: HAMP domain-containing histidine kinase, partial [Bacteriovoracaceae bacterium]|nr:HAMP domain-containing histidine kinase [Bacteriovoracaceae bacterium]